MKKWIWITTSITISFVLIFVAFAMFSGMKHEGNAHSPIVWKESEVVHYIPAERDLGMWRSVRLPSAPLVQEMLRASGKIPDEADPSEIEQAIFAWYQEARKTAYIGPDPVAFKQLLEREQALLNPDEDVATIQEDQYPTPEKSLLGVVVEFYPPGGMEEISRTFPIDPSDPSLGCEVITQTFPALSLGDDPPPGPRDNFSFYKEGGFTVDDYRSAFFEVGPDAGYGIVREDLGGIDLSGITLNNYLLEMSRGTYTTTGDILDAPVTVPHAHEYYGMGVYYEDGDGNCVVDTFSDERYDEYIQDVIDAVIVEYGDTVDWSRFDADNDHIIDLLVTIHAGYAYQNGGGDDRLSTTSSNLFPNMRQIGGLSTPGDTSDDYFVEGFNVDPEQLDVGGIQEEYEHQFGLPDLYTVDGSTSNAWWGAHSAGAWGGELGGTRPVGHNLWQDWMLGWRDPLVIDYNDPLLLTGNLEVDIGRARYTPGGTEDGVVVRLPEEVVNIQNEAGEGIGWYSTSGDLMDKRVTKQFDLSSATAPITFTFDAYWDIEKDWDYGYIEVSIDDGETWESLPDLDAVLTDSNPFGSNLGWGLTGSGSGLLRFDLSAYAGETIGLRFRYLTDTAVSNPGWWVDNIAVADSTGVIYENDLEEDFSDWVNEGWLVVPVEQVNQRYYTIEWRDNNGFDKSLNNPYYVAYSTPVEPPPELDVDRIPATTPGMIIAYRDMGQGFDYYISDDLETGISYGPKYGLITIDSHFDAVRFNTKFDAFQNGWVGYTMYGRTKSGNAAFGLTPTNQWTARLGYDVDLGEYLTEPLETKTWASMPPVHAFHDSFGYYPGLYYPGTGGVVYEHDWDSSAAIPAKEPYSTRVTDLDGNILYELHGAPIGPASLGTGNPGDEHLQYGLHAEVVAGNDEKATIRLWNSLFEVNSSAKAYNLMTAGITGTLTFSIDENIGGYLNDPYFVIELPANLEYVGGSSSELLALDNSYASADQIMAQINSLGFDALFSQAKVQSEDVKYLVWSSEDIGTKLGASYSFDVKRIDEEDSVLYVWYFKNGTESFQADELEVEFVTYKNYIPLVAK